MNRPSRASDAAVQPKSEPRSGTQAIASQLRWLRHERGWTAQQLADRCAAAGHPSLTRSTIAKIESLVRKSVRIDELAGLAAVLGPTIWDCLDRPAFGQPDARSHRRWLGMKLRQARQHAGLSQSAAAQALRTTPTRVSKIEGTLIPVTVSDINGMIDVYNVQDSVDAEIRQTLARIAELEPPRELPLPFGRMRDREPRAESISAFRTGHIPGPLQTGPYMRALLGLNKLPGSDDQLAAGHLARRQLLTNNTTGTDTGSETGSGIPPWYHVILSETALRRMPWGRTGEFQADQIAHLLHLVRRRATLTLQILTYAAPTAEVPNDFTVMRFPGDEPDLAYVEFDDTSLTFTTERKIGAFRQSWEPLHRAALSPTASVAFLAGFLKHVRNHGEAPEPTYRSEQPALAAQAL